MILKLNCNEIFSNKLITEHERELDSKDWQMLHCTLMAAMETKKGYTTQAKKKRSTLISGKGRETKVERQEVA